MKKSIFRGLIIAWIAVFCLVVHALGADGLTDTEIHLGQWGPQTGPAAAWGSVARGTDAYFKMINDKGGINGRKIVYHYFDDGYNPAKTKAGVKELQESDHGIFAWVVGVGSATGMAVKEYLADRKIPWVGPAAGSLAWVTPPSRYLFAVYPLYTAEAMVLTQYAVENLKMKKIAMVYQNDEYGKNGEKGLKKQLASYGLEPVLTIPASVSENDLKPHVAALKKSGAEVVMLWTNPLIVVKTMLTAKAMGFQPQWMSTSTCSDTPFMFKITRGVFAGTIVGSFSALPNSDHPLIRKYKTDAFDKYAAPDERFGTFYLAGFGFAEPLVEALKRAGRDLTRERLIQELEGMKDFQGILGPVSFGRLDPNDPYTRQGTKDVFIIKCGDDGQAVQLTDWTDPHYTFD